MKLKDLFENSRPGAHRAPATFKGKTFWSGSVDLTDGNINEVHTYEEAEQADFHHSMYFSPGEVEKMKDGDATFFWVESKEKVNVEWRNTFPARTKNQLILKIKSQIKFI